MCVNYAMKMKRFQYIYSCKPTRKFWEDLSRKIKTNTNKEVDFSSKDIILGFQEKQMWPANILLIIMKKYIFTASKKEKTPQLVEALEMLKSVYMEQEYVSKIQNQECKFKKKMGFYPRIDFVTYILYSIYSHIVIL